MVVAIRYRALCGTTPLAARKRNEISALAKKFICCGKNPTSRTQTISRDTTNLPPVKSRLTLLKTQLDPFCRCNPQCERQNGNTYRSDIPPLSICQIYAEQNHISGLCIGEYPAPAQIGICVKKTACDCQNCTNTERSTCAGSSYFSRLCSSSPVSVMFYFQDITAAVFCKARAFPEYGKALFICRQAAGWYR